MENTEYKKDYSKLRPFDLEAAKSGEAMCDKWGDNEYVMFDFITRYSTGEVHLSVRHVDSGFEYHNTSPNHVRMKPLAWVEGLPVYKGDVLWNKTHPEYRYNVNHVSEHGTIVTARNETDAYWEFPDNLTWNKPKQKVKRKVWINVYPEDESYVYPSKEVADVYAYNEKRIACVETEIEYEV